MVLISISVAFSFSFTLKKLNMFQNSDIVTVNKLGPELKVQQSSYTALGEVFKMMLIIRISIGKTNYP